MLQVGHCSLARVPQQHTCGAIMLAWASKASRQDKAPGKRKELTGKLASPIWLVKVYWGRLYPPSFV